MAHAYMSTSTISSESFDATKDIVAPPKPKNTESQPLIWGKRVFNVLSLRCLGNSPVAIAARLTIGLFEATIGAFAAGAATTIFGGAGAIPVFLHGAAIVICAFKDMFPKSDLDQLAEPYYNQITGRDEDEPPTAYHDQALEEYLNGTN